MKFTPRTLLDRRFLAILLMGFSSGLPLLLVGGTLRYWLADTGIDIKAIGLFSLVSLPYALKFLWAPVLDRTPLPLLGARFGRRRGWGFAIQFCLAGALLLLAQNRPDTHAGLTAFLAVLVAFLSASQDVVIDALRIEMLDPSEYALAGAITGVGYRVGMLVAGAGALYIAQYVDWKAAYTAMAALLSIGAIGLAIAPEPADSPGPTASLAVWWREAVVAPLADFARRQSWPAILAFVVLYKLAPVLALSLTSPFYKDMGFTKAEVASVTKVFGLAATLGGGFLGAWLVNRIGIWRCLWWGGVTQVLALYCFAALATAPHSLPLLMLAILGENVTGAVAATAFGTYLSALCNKQFTATQFALLTALAALTGETLTSGMGYAESDLGWLWFFVVTPLASLPGLWLLWRLKSVIGSLGGRD